MKAFKESFGLIMGLYAGLIVVDLIEKRLKLLDKKESES